MDLVTELVPDIGSLPKIRKKRASKHDFKDGKGRVFAHRHDNGGGWVADTAYVAPTVEVKRYAQVYDFARVIGNCRLDNHARVFDHACLYDNVIVGDKAEVCGHAVLRNTTNVRGTAFVADNADLSGSTTVRGNVRVGGGVKLINTGCHNNAEHRAQILTGSVVAVDSHFYEVCKLHGRANLFNTTLRNVLVGGSAHIVGATIHTQLTFEAHNRLYSKDGAAQHYINTCIAQFHDVQMFDGRIIVPPMFISGDNVFIHSEITLQPEDAPPNLFQPTDKVYYVRVTARRSSDLFGLSNTALENVRNNRPANPNANAQTNVSPILNAGSQRRILRLEGAT